jgi:hypothetical protein
VLEYFHLNLTNFNSKKYFAAYFITDRPTDEEKKFYIPRYRLPAVCKTYVSRRRQRGNCHDLINARFSHEDVRQFLKANPRNISDRGKGRRKTSILRHSWRTNWWFSLSAANCPIFCCNFLRWRGSLPQLNCLSDIITLYLSQSKSYKFCALHPQRLQE